MKQYDIVYKDEICKQLNSGKTTVTKLSKETDIPENTLYKWNARYRANTAKPFVDNETQEVEVCYRQIV